MFAPFSRVLQIFMVKALRITALKLEKIKKQPFSKIAISNFEIFYKNEKYPFSLFRKDLIPSY